MTCNEVLDCGPVFVLRVGHCSSFQLLWMLDSDLKAVNDRRQSGVLQKNFSWYCVPDAFSVRPSNQKWNFCIQQIEPPGEHIKKSVVCQVKYSTYKVRWRVLPQFHQCYEELILCRMFGCLLWLYKLHQILVQGVKQCPRQPSHQLAFDVIFSHSCCTASSHSFLASSLSLLKLKTSFSTLWGRHGASGAVVASTGASGGVLRSSLCSFAAADCVFLAGKSEGM